MEAGRLHEKECSRERARRPFVKIGLPTRLVTTLGPQFGNWARRSMRGRPSAVGAPAFCTPVFVNAFVQDNSQQR